MRMATTPFASRQQQPHTLSLSWSSVVAAVASSRSFNYKLISRKREFLVSFLCLTFESQNERTNRLNFSLSSSSSSSMAVSVCVCVPVGWVTMTSASVPKRSEKCVCALSTFLPFSPCVELRAPPAALGFVFLLRGTCTFNSGPTDQKTRNTELLSFSFFLLL